MSKTPEEHVELGEKAAHRANEALVHWERLEYQVTMIDRVAFFALQSPEIKQRNLERLKQEMKRAGADFSTFKHIAAETIGLGSAGDTLLGLRQLDEMPPPDQP